jgi:hypothetical protein
VQDVAANRHGEPAEPALAPTDRQRVEQRLGRVLVVAVAGINDRTVDLLGKEMNRTRFGMADDEHVGVHRVQRHRRVDQGLALDHGARRHRHVDHVAAEPLAGDLERGAGAGRALDEAIDDRAAAQEAALLLGLPAELDITVGEVEDVVDVVGRQTLDPEQMPVPERGLGGASLHEPGTIGRVVLPRNNEYSVSKARHL